MSSMADRFASVMSAADAPPPAAAPEAAPVPAPSTPDPVSEPASSASSPAPLSPASADPGSAVGSSAPAPAAGSGEDLSFDDTPELNFDEEAAPAESVPEPVPAAAAPDKPAAAPDDASDVAEIAKVLKAGGLPKQIEYAFLKTNRGKAMLQLYKAERILSEPPNEGPDGVNTGGIGFMPNPDQIKDWHAKASDLEAAEYDFENNPANYVQNYFGADDNGFRPGAIQVLSQLPATIDKVYAHAVETGNQQLQQQAVEAYASFARPAILSYVNGLYEKARAYTDPAARDYYLNAARAVEFDLTGKHRPDDQLAPPTPVDALTQREQAIAAREERLQAWQRQNLNTAQKAAEKEILDSCHSQLTKDCEKALSSVRAGMSERAWRAAVNDFRQEVVNLLGKNREAARQFNFALAKGRTAQSPDERRAVADLYRQLSRQVIQQRYRPVLGELATGAVRANESLHAAAQNGSALRAPAAGGGPAAPQSVVPAETPIARKPGESLTDYFQRRMSTRMAETPA